MYSCKLYLTSVVNSIHIRRRYSTAGIIMYTFTPCMQLSIIVEFLSIICVCGFQRFGWSIWKKDDVINTAEKKILLLSFIVGCVAALNGIYFTLSVSAQAKRNSALNLNFLCELPGYIIDKGNDMTTCSKDELEKYSYTGLSSVSTIFTFALLPLVFLLTMMKWYRFMQLMKLLFRKKESEQKNIQSLLKLRSLYEMKIITWSESNI